MNKKTVSLLLALASIMSYSGVILDVWSSRFCRELGLLNGRHFDVVRLEEDA